MTQLGFESTIGDRSGAAPGVLSRLLHRTARRTKSHWGADPWGRADARYWNGRRWTEHVVRDGRQAIDHPLRAVVTLDPAEGER